jgi:hypothetical protein
VVRDRRGAAGGRSERRPAGSGGATGKSGKPAPAATTPPAASASPVAAAPETPVPAAVVAGDAKRPDTAPGGQRANKPKANPKASPQTEVQEVTAAVENLNIPAGSAWGAKSTLANKIKEAERAAVAKAAEKEAAEKAAALAAATQTKEEVTTTKETPVTDAESGDKAGKPRSSRRDRKPKAPKTEAAPAPAATAPVEAQAPQQQETPAPAPAPTPVVEVAPKPVEVVKEVEKPFVAPPAAKPAPAVTVAPPVAASDNYVNLGKWDAAAEPVTEAFRFGSFGDASPNRNATSEADKAPKSWPKKTQPSAAPAWSDVTVQSSASDFNTAAPLPMGSLTQPIEPAQSSLSLNQTIDGSKSSGAGSNRSQQRKGDGEHGGRQSQQAPPGMNPRGGLGSFGGMMPTAVPYGMPYEHSPQAPSLQGNYGGFPGASAASSAPGTGAAGASDRSAVAPAASAGTSVAPGSQQNQYQAPPPGMPMSQQYLPYQYNPNPYFPPFAYYGGQPQGYNYRGHNMYQPPRNMYGDGFGGGAPGMSGYHDMYGNQGGQFDGLHGAGGMQMHHGSTERGSKGPKNTGSSAGAQQSGVPTGAQPDFSGYGGGYGGSYPHDQSAPWPQQYGGWGSAPMMYNQSSPTGAGNVGSVGGGRGGSSGSGSGAIGGSAPYSYSSRGGASAGGSQSGASSGGSNNLPGQW